MKKYMLIFLAAFLAACSNSATPSVPLENRISALESDRSELESRVTELEKANKEVLKQYAEIKKERDARSAEVAKLKSDQSTIQEGQKLLCSATLDC